MAQQGRGINRALRLLTLLWWLIFVGWRVALGFVVSTKSPLQDKGLNAELLFAWSVAGLLLAILHVRYRAVPVEAKSPTPARSGVSVVIATGIAGAVEAGGHAHGAGELIFPALILLASSIVALAVYRFATRNASNIGEARFITVAPRTSEESS